jgi:hypothetical protein
VISIDMLPDGVLLVMLDFFAQVSKREVVEAWQSVIGSP